MSDQQNIRRKKRREPGCDTCKHSLEKGEDGLTRWFSICGKTNWEFSAQNGAFVSPTIIGPDCTCNIHEAK